MDDRMEPALAQVMAQQRRRSSTIHIIIAEDRYRLVARDGIRKPRGSRLHPSQAVRIGQQVADGRIEVGFDLLRRHAAPCKYARQ
jgi:hypothetical protein